MVTNGHAPRHVTLVARTRAVAGVDLKCVDWYCEPLSLRCQGVRDGWGTA
jgi:hypothetical protein